MHGLKMPEILPGARIERQHAIRVQIVALAVSAVQLVLARSGGHVDDSPLYIDGDFSPHIDAAHVLVGVLWPGVVAELARSRNRMEHPSQLARDHVERA